MKYKKITKSGSITIPADLRRDMNLQGGDAVDITTTANGIIINAHTPRCIFCDGIDGVVAYQGKRVCKGCIKKMGGLISE